MLGARDYGAGSGPRSAHDFAGYAPLCERDELSEVCESDPQPHVNRRLAIMLIGRAGPTRALHAVLPGLDVALKVVGVAGLGGWVHGERSPARGERLRRHWFGLASASTVISPSET
jgi:hypothetical protein